MKLDERKAFAASTSGATHEAAREEKPVYLRTAERLAGGDPAAAKALIDKYASRMEESSYPTPECLTPGEVQDAALGAKLPEDRVAHAQHCEVCNGLLLSSKPPAQGEEALIGEVRQAPEDQPASGSPVVQTPDLFAQVWGVLRSAAATVMKK